jgi:type-F conjugative transfer system pilin assembly thiol-disulfide isomerase TrbB
MKKLAIITIAVMSLWLGAASAENAHTESTRDHFFQTHGFVFFFASTCPYCHQFSPVLSQVSKRLGASVLPLSFDNQPLPEFQEVLPATSDWTTVAFKNASIHYPALFIANPKTQALYPVSIGSLNEMELTTRIEALIPKIMAYENTEVTA